ncbi:MAG: hypothetical protein R3Y68_01135 [Rikenellaceae bacterium]
MKKKLNLLMLACSILSYTQAGAQTLQTFKGEVGGGNETYTYYDDPQNGKTIKHGTYKFVNDQKSDEGATMFYTINGSFKNGYKDGVWSYDVKCVDVQSGSDNLYFTTVKKMVNTFTDGMPNGSWRYNYSGKVRRRLFSLSGWSWAEYETITPVNIVVTFNNGCLVGDVTFKTPFVDVSGKLDNEGWYIGTWNITDRKPLTFVNRVAQFYPADRALTAMQSKVSTLQGKAREDYCIENHLKVDTVRSKTYFDLNDGYFDSPDWLHVHTGGDKSYENDENNNRKYKMDYGKFLEIYRVEAKTIEQADYNWKNRDSETLQKTLNIYRIHFSKEDIKKVEERIAMLKQQERAGVSNRAACDTAQELYENVRLRHNNIYYCEFNSYEKGEIYKEKLRDSKMSYGHIAPPILTPDISLWNDTFTPTVKKMVKAYKSGYNESTITSTIDEVYKYIPRAELYGPVYNEDIDYKIYIEKINNTSAQIDKFAVQVDEMSGINTQFIDVCTSYSNIEGNTDNKNLNKGLVALSGKIAQTATNKLTKSEDIKSISSIAEQTQQLMQQCNDVESNYIALSVPSTKKKLNKYYNEIIAFVINSAGTSADFSKMESALNCADLIITKMQSLITADTSTLESSISKEKDLNRRVELFVE